MRHSAWSVALVTVFAGATAVHAGWPESCLPPNDAPAARPNETPVWSIQFLSGYFGMTGLGPNEGNAKDKSSVDYLPQALRIGCECPHRLVPGCWLEGTYEALLEYNASPILRQFGTYFTGPCAILRYNYRRDDAVVVPYLQGGAGFVLTDAYHEQRQRLIGQPVEFLLRVECGVRFMVTDDVSLDVEGGLQHISNAGLASRNGGINTLGVSVGFTYEFGRK